MKKLSISFASLFFIMLFFCLWSGKLLGQNEKSGSDRLKEQTGISALNYIQVSESVVMVHNEKDQGSNMVCVALNEGLIFWDCSLFTEIAAEFRAAMEAKYNRKTIAFVQSHAHSDHFFGMGAFNDVPCITTMNAKRMFEYQLSIDYKKYKQNFMQIFPLFDKALESFQLKMPTIWFDNELQIGSGDKKLILRNAGGHSECSIYAYFEKEKVLLAGDDVQVDYHPYFGDQTGNLEDWVKTLKTWEEMEIEHLCPGHGSMVNKNYLTETRIFFETLESKMQELKKANTSEEEVLEEINAIKAYWPLNLEKPGWYDPSIISVYRRTAIKD